MKARNPLLGQREREVSEILIRVLWSSGDFRETVGPWRRAREESGRLKRWKAGLEPEYQLTLLGCLVAES